MVGGNFNSDLQFLLSSLSGETIQCARDKSSTQSCHKVIRKKGKKSIMKRQ